VYFPCCFLKMAIIISHSHYLHVTFVSIQVFQTFNRMIFGRLSFPGARCYVVTVSHKWYVMGKRLGTTDIYRCIHGRNLVGDTGDVSPHFFRRGGQNMACPPTFSRRVCIWRGFKTKCYICHVLCEEFFVLDVTHSNVDVETEFGVVSLILIFL